MAKKAKPPAGKVAGGIARRGKMKMAEVFPLRVELT